eukprot:g2302.t1
MSECHTPDVRAIVAEQQKLCAEVQLHVRQRNFPRAAQAREALVRSGWATDPELRARQRIAVSLLLRVDEMRKFRKREFSAVELEEMESLAESLELLATRIKLLMRWQQQQEGPCKMAFKLLLTGLLALAGASSPSHERFKATVPAALHHSLARAAHIRGAGTASIADAIRAPPSGARDVSPAGVTGRLRVTPARFGGDPTGATDSTDAVLVALQTCINASIASVRGDFSFGARDALGCTVDLDGGEYLISKTLVIPTGLSNMRIETGSLVANPDSAHWASPAPAATATATATAAAGRALAALGTCPNGTKTFPTSRTDWWCQGGRPAPGAAATTADAAECEQACCADAGCQVWQHCGNASACFAEIPGHQTCWLAPVDKCSQDDPAPQAHGWVGGSTTVPPPPTPPPPTPPPVPMTNQFLIQVGGTEPCRNPQGSCNEAINFPSLFLDGSRVANGLSITSPMGATVGPGTYVLNFTQYGLKVVGGHEVMVAETWFGETNFDHKFTQARPPQATAIFIESNDHYISNSIVFSSKIGLDMGGAANWIGGLHVWFPWNNATHFPEVRAFYDHGRGLNRYHGCYIDCSTAEFREATHLWWINGVSLGGRGIEFTGAKGPSNVQIRNNVFVGGSISLLTDDPANATQQVGTDVIIENNQFSSSGRASRATLTVSHPTTATSTWTFDFCDRLVFPNITNVLSLVTAATAGFPVAIARPPQGCTLTVETSEPMTGSITAKVDSSHTSGQCIMC